MWRERKSRRAQRGVSVSVPSAGAPTTVHCPVIVPSASTV
jgi:hypothetical protein